MAKTQNIGDKDIQYKLFGDLDMIFDEKGSQFLSMRKVAWYDAKKSSEPTEDKAKLDIRKWMADDSGKDKPLRGWSFLTEEGPHNLTEALIDNGYGNTKKVLVSLKKRDDFEESVKHMYDEEEESGEEFFDARADLLED